MREINVTWGMRQGLMITLGTLADAGDVQVNVDVTPLTDAASRTFSVRIRRADATTYPAAAGVSPVDGVVSYALQAEDLDAPGALWLTLRGTLGETYVEWTFLGWVSQAQYDGAYGSPMPYWAEALLALLYASNGAAGSGGGSDGSGGGDGGTAVIAPTSIPITVLSTDWSGGSATVTNAAIHAASIGWVRLPTGASAAQYELYAAAMIRVAAQAEGSITLAAGGAVPTAALILELLLY